MMTIADIVTQIKYYQTPHVCVTGGEPLAQGTCLELLNALIKYSYQVSLETSGSIDISAVNTKVNIIMDLKTPSSLESNSNLLSNIRLLKTKDEAKFVISNQKDFAWSVAMIKQYQFNCEILFSAVANELESQQLAQWILDNRLIVRFQTQLHKTLWGDVAGK